MVNATAKVAAATLQLQLLRFFEVSTYLFGRPPKKYCFYIMCGIVAYIGNRDAYPILIKGLQRLEYRGYDSAGVALINKSGVLVILFFIKYGDSVIVLP